MSGRGRDFEADLAKLREAAAEDLVSLSDPEIEEELRAAGEDSSLLAADFQAALQRARADLGHRRLKTAREALNSMPAQAPRVAVVLAFPFERKRKLVERFARERDQGLLGQVTMAARNEEELSERDINSLISKLIELGLMDEHGETR